jgi:fatty-acyl-CoA synthase
VSSKAAGWNANKAWLRALEMTAPISSRPTLTLPSTIIANAERFGDKPALIGECASLTHRELAGRIQQFAHWARHAGIQKGDAVALMMRNQPDFLAFWLGVTLTGGIVALLNTNLPAASLAHGIDAARPKIVVAEVELAPRILEAAEKLSTKPARWCLGGAAPGFEPIEPVIDSARGLSAAPPMQDAPTLSDPALYIYTSGTTGLPKAARLSHHRLMQWSHWFAGLLDAGPDDRTYDCLPLYHSVGGVVAPFAVLVAGGSVVIREKFSASRLWQDIGVSGSTMFQYIGELCRYLVHAPETPADRAHNLRLAVGNGLRPDVWETFQSRFAIPRIVEFYAATEGNFSLVNVEGRVGAIGRVPAFLAHRQHVEIVRFDASTGMPVRGADGRCIRCATDEPGETISKITVKGGDHTGRFDGYTDAAATERKILSDVFEPGDKWFRSGDLMRKDPRGFYFFVDRIGDTFRWKGENVATLEVADALLAFSGIREAMAYGVEVPGADGRVGMAALIATGPLDLEKLRCEIGAGLPAYARPRFLRLCRTFDLTSTFKPIRLELASNGYDPSVSDDPVYVDDPSSERYIRVDKDLFARLKSGAFRVS